MTVTVQRAGMYKPRYGNSYLFVIVFVNENLDSRTTCSTTAFIDEVFTTFPPLIIAASHVLQAHMTHFFVQGFQFFVDLCDLPFR